MNSYWIAVFEDSVYENYLPLYDSSEDFNVDSLIIGIELADW